MCPVPGARSSRPVRPVPTAGVALAVVCLPGTGVHLPGREKSLKLTGVHLARPELFRPDAGPAPITP